MIRNQSGPSLPGFFWRRRGAMGTNNVQMCLDAVLKGLDRTGNGESLDIRDIYGPWRRQVGHRVDRLGGGDGVPYREQCEFEFKFVTSKGQFAIKRHHHNALRGDASSVEGHNI